MKKLTTEEYIKKANEVHNNKYDYRLINYINSRVKIEIYCVEHGKFKQRANNHLLGIGCPKCSGKNKEINEILEDFNKIYNYKYDYSLVEYKNKNSLIKIICKEHGVFEKLAYAHNIGKGCPKCGRGTLTSEEFIKKSNIRHKNKYDYSLVNYIGVREKVTIICPIHGKFNQKSKDHLNGCDCPNCSESKGEKIIREFLEDKKIKFTINKRFSKCRNKTTLPFDFYLSDHNICIEYDGIQHFESIKYWLGDKGLYERKLRDQIKTEFCKNNNISLIRIKYNENIINKLNTINF